MNSEPELWRFVEGTDYEVSTHGRFRRGKRLLSNRPNHNGYVRANMRINGKKVQQPLHRLVVTAFVGPAPPGRREIDHIDRNRGNNRLSNLRWVSQEENNENRTFPVGEFQNNAKITTDQAIEIRRRKLSGETASSIVKDYEDISIWLVYRVASGRGWKHIIQSADKASGEVGR